VFLKDLNQK